MNGYTLAKLKDGDWLVVQENSTHQMVVGRGGNIQDAIEIVSQHSGMPIEVKQEGGDYLTKILIGKPIEKAPESPKSKQKAGVK